MYSQGCAMCQNYESQLQLVQKDLVAIRDKEKLLMGNMRVIQVS